MKYSTPSPQVLFDFSQMSKPELRCNLAYFGFLSRTDRRFMLYTKLLASLLSGKDCSHGKTSSSF